MIKGKATVQSPIGIHARPAALIASYVLKCESEVRFCINGVEVDPGNYIKLMSLGTKYGDEIEIIVDGPDEKEVFEELVRIIETD